MIFRRQQVAAISAHARWDFTAGAVNAVSPSFALLYVQDVAKKPYVK